MTRHAYPIGVFCIDTLPNQPQIAHCHSFFVKADQRGQGHGHTLKMRQKAALRAGEFDYATCTVDGENVRQKAVLTHAGWAKLAEFKNSRTGGITELWGWTVVDPLCNPTE